MPNYVFSPHLLLQTKDKLSCASISLHLRVSYAGRTARRLSERIKDPHPRRLNKGPTSNKLTIITMALIEPHHLINTSVLSRGQLAKDVKSQILSTVEKIAIHLNKPQCRNNNWSTLTTDSRYAYVINDPVKPARNLPTHYLSWRWMYTIQFSIVHHHYFSITQLQCI